MILTLLAFVVSAGSAVVILMPKRDLIFAQMGRGLYEDGFLVRDDMPEVYRRLTYQLDWFWKSNDAKIRRMVRAFAVAAAALVVQIVALAALMGGNILSS